MVLALVILSGLLTVAAIATLQITRGMKASSQDRRRSSALFAAESGVSAGMDFLRRNVSLATYYSDFVSPENSSPQQPLGIAGNTVEPGNAGNLFDPDLKLWYEVTILNNADDVSYTTGADSDAIVILRSVGHGPGGSQVTLEVEVSGTGSSLSGRPCPGYAQRGIAEDGAGRNDCLSDIDSSVVTTFSPSGS